MSLLYQKHASRPLTLDNRVEPELYRDVFPYTHVSRIEFDDTFLVPRPADPMFITDTTFRDGQQARPPYTVKQIARIYDLLHKLGGKSGLIQASEFFMYSPKDRKAIEVCRSRGYRFPRVTGWIRANMDDLKIAHDMEFDEVGLLTSMSDYHIFLKLGKTREQAMNDYLKVVTKALEWGIVPRCHFEDVTRADIYGFCLPFARKLMELSHEASMPIKIRLCDTMGYGVPFPGAALPRSVQRIVRAFPDEAGVPGAWLEWHGHNDFHKVLVNGVTAWLYGCGGVNGTLMGFGERTGNAPLEALVIDYISLTGNDEAADPTVITEIAQYFEKELDYRIPDNYPFAGKDFNATSAGIHVDGLAKNEEIYNIFDTTKILNRSVPIIINDKAGRAGVAYWINQQFNLPPERQVSKKHPAVGQIHTRIMAAYEDQEPRPPFHAGTLRQRVRPDEAHRRGTGLQPRGASGPRLPVDRRFGSAHRAAPALRARLLVHPVCLRHRREGALHRHRHQRSRRSEGLQGVPDRVRLLEPRVVPPAHAHRKAAHHERPSVSGHGPAHHHRLHGDHRRQRRDHRRPRRRHPA